MELAGLGLRLARRAVYWFASRFISDGVPQRRSVYSWLSALVTGVAVSGRASP